MSEHQAWIVAELVDSGDSEAVLEAAVDDEPDATRGQREGDRVVVYDDRPNTSGVLEGLRSVSGHVSRVLEVASYEGGRGTTRSRYYADGLDEPTEEIRNVDARWFVAWHFDYYAAEYGIESAI